MIKPSDFFNIRAQFIRIHNLAGFCRQYSMDISDVHGLVPLNFYL